MTPAARCQAAIELLDLIEAGDRPADRILNGWFRRRRYAGSGDRAAIQSLVYAILRRRGEFDWWIERAAGEITTRTRVLAALQLAAPWPADAAARAFAPGEYSPNPLTSDENRLGDDLTNQDMALLDIPRHAALNIPAWLESKLEKAFGADLEREMVALIAPGTVDLRVNTLKTDRPTLLSRLAAEEFEATPTEISPVGLRLAKRRPFRHLAAFRDGLFEPQDEGSQVATLLIGARPGQTVLDYCAGAGGKALALAATMENQGRLLLSDRDGRRLARAGPRLQRAGVEIAECQPNVTDDKAWLLRHAGYFDIVLTDAPCSGSGAWRRQPEGKWRISPERLAELTLEQAAILDRAAALTRIGGRLVYITCSLLPEENEAGIERFLGNWAGTFDLDPIDDEWRRRLDPGAIDQSGFVRLTPGRHATDGFFIAILKRKGQ